MKKTHKTQTKTSGNWLVKQAVTFKKNWGLLLLCVPTLVGMILFDYAPMAGMVMAFKKYTFKDGIWGSKWIGLSNFKFFFSSTAAGYIIRNTLLYFFLTTVVGLIAQVVVALLLYEVKGKKSLKFYQTCMQFPRFMSWAVIGFVTYAILDPVKGVMNQLLQAFNLEAIDVYTTQEVWPFIMTVCITWSGLGAGMIMYYAKLMGTDPALFEAARIDGANKLQQIWHVSMPSLVPLIVVLQIMNLGSIFKGSFDPFYIIPRDTAVLYPITDNIATFIMRGLQDAQYGPASAMGLVQSVIGFVMVVAANAIVTKISPENAMF